VIWTFCIAGVIAVIVMILLFGWWRTRSLAREAERELSDVGVCDIDRLAEECVRVFREAFGLELTLDDVTGCARTLEDHWSTFRLEQAFGRRGFNWYFLKPVGALVGKLIQQRVDATWHDEPNGPPTLRVADRLGAATIRPFEKVLELTRSPSRGKLFGYAATSLVYRAPLPAGIQPGVIHPPVLALVEPDPVRIAEIEAARLSPDQFRDKMREHERPTRELVVERCDQGPEPVTKISGTPWWPSGVPRPSCPHGHAMCFIAQVRLSDVPGLETTDSSLLSFHYCDECSINGAMPWGWKDTGTRGSYDVSIFTDVDQRTIDGLGIMAPSDINPHKVSFRDVVEVPLPEDAAIDVFETPKDYPGGKDDWDEDIYPGLVHVHRSKIGGWPTWVQSSEWPPTVETERVEFVLQLDWALCKDLAWCAGGYAYVFVKLPNTGPPIGELAIQTT
jgi:uncharacterized protein YwqG